MIDFCKLRMQAIEVSQSSSFIQGAAGKQVLEQKDDL